MTSLSSNSFWGRDIGEIIIESNQCPLAYCENPIEHDAVIRKYSLGGGTLVIQMLAVEMNHLLKGKHAIPNQGLTVIDTFILIMRNSGRSALGKYLRPRQSPPTPRGGRLLYPPFLLKSQNLQFSQDLQG